MARMLKDLQAVFRGLQAVAQNGMEYQLSQAAQRWDASSFRPLARTTFRNLGGNQVAPIHMSEIPARIGAVMQGVQEQLKVMTGIYSPTLSTPDGLVFFSSDKYDKTIQKKEYPTVAKEIHHNIKGKPEEGEANEAAKRAREFMNPPIAPMDPVDKNEVVHTPEMSNPVCDTNPDKSSEAAHRLGKFMNEEVASKDDTFQRDSAKSKLSFTDAASEEFNIKDLKKQQDRPVVGLGTATHSQKQTLGPKSRERKVPASRAARLASFGGLAAGLGFGAVAEVARRTLGGGQKDGGILNKSPFLTDANAERIVDTLCRVRGAALKLGQMLSIQDTSLLNPQVQQIFERVRQSADFMPRRQMEKVLEKELGPRWYDALATFEDKPVAAASIGQVHFGKLKDGREVAVKIQYPGVAEGIDSDIKNLLGILAMWNIFPKGMYMDNLMRVARMELAWECDYEREAEFIRRFRNLLKDDPVFIVPDVVKELSGKRVLTTEYIYGEPLDKATGYDEATRNMIAKNFLRLCFEELFVHRLMQTDPNWSNFFYNQEKKKIYLLDFGASRTYEKDFIDSYIQVIRGAAIGDRELVLKNSHKLGFLTGMETKSLEAAHVDAAMILGEPFRSHEPFDFSQQDITKRIHTIIPVMAEQRLTPPPDESYSLHRKVAGAFLLCTNLKAKISCKEVFDDIYARYQEQK